MSFIKVKERRTYGDKVVWANRILPSSSINNIESDTEGITVITFDNGHQIEVVESVDFIFKQMTNPRISYIVDSEREVLAPESDCFVKSPIEHFNWKVGELAKDISRYPEFLMIAPLDKDTAIAWLTCIGIWNRSFKLPVNKFVIVACQGVGETETQPFMESILAIAFNGEKYLLYQSIRR